MVYSEPVNPKYVVAQTGARRGYAVPKLLADAGMLERFYTDVCGNVGWGKWLALLAVIPVVKPKLQRLGNRRVPESIRSRTRTFALPNLRWWWRSAMGTEDPTDEFRMDVLRAKDLGLAAVRAGFGDATHMYAMFSEFWPTMLEARRRGLTVVAEVYILLSAERILAEERRAFPGWDDAPPDWDAVREEFGTKDVLFRGADHFICPSEAVRDDLVRHWGVAEERTMVVPYGMSPAWLDLERKPQCGRVLFAGTADLRKGIQYLAMAAEKLRGRGRKYEFRIAGNVTDMVKNQELCQHLTFLGRVPRDRIHEEFQQADIFVLPSLAEGSAEVTYEALAAGIPLIVTPAAGAVARDGIECRIVAERDPEALANAIEEVIENRELRERLSLGARERARDYTWDKYGERLVTALRNLEK